MVKVIVADSKLNCDNLVGTFVDSSNYTTLLTEDADVYEPSIDGKLSEHNIVAKFRKGVFTKEEQDLCYSGLINAATESQNRGKAAGPRGDILQASGRGGREWVSQYQIDVLEFLTRTANSLTDDDSLESIKRRHDTGKPEDVTRGRVWLRSEVCLEHDPYFGWFDRWVTGLGNQSDEQKRDNAQYIIDNYISETNYAQTVKSGVAGFYSRYPRIPFGRATAFTDREPENFAKSFPFLSKLDGLFHDLLPKRYAAQRTAADLMDPRFTIANTVFSTLTVNHNFRTAAHMDAGDYSDGFSNLTALGSGWEGAELILPEYRIAIDVRPGDLLLVANHTAIHGNSPLGGENPDRMTIVAYLREDLLECKSWEYEQLRKQFVEERKNNHDHRLWRKLWNGVSPSMWDDKEWHEYMIKHNMDDPYGAHHSGSLSEFF